MLQVWNAFNKAIFVFNSILGTQYMYWVIINGKELLDPTMYPAPQNEIVTSLNNYGLSVTAYAGDIVNRLVVEAFGITTIQPFNDVDLPKLQQVLQTWWRSNSYPNARVEISCMQAYFL